MPSASWRPRRSSSPRGRPTPARSRAAARPSSSASTFRPPRRPPAPRATTPSIARKELYAKSGPPPPRPDSDSPSSPAGAADQDLLVPGAAPGTWYLLVYGTSVPAPSAYTLLAQAADV